MEVEQLVVLEKSPFSTPNEIIRSGKDNQWMLKPLGGKVIMNRMYA